MDRLNSNSLARCASPARAGRAPAAFTLVEMLVSLAVLALALSIVGIVFTVTTRTASQAAAYAEAQNWTRQCLDQLAEDLRYCAPGEGPLVLAGRTVPAALTEDFRQGRRYHRELVGDPTVPLGAFDPLYSPSTGNPPVPPPIGANPNPYSDPRADILMFFTNRALASQAPPRTDPGVTSPDLPYYAGSRFAPVQVVYGHAALADAVPSGASGLHTFGTTLRHIDLQGANQISDIPAAQWHLARRVTLIRDVTAPTLTFTAADRLNSARCYTITNNQPGDVASLNLDAFRQMLSEPLSVLQAPYTAPSWGVAAYDNVLGTLYVPGNPTNHHVATVLEAPPADLRSNLGVHMLPGCVWFQVEFLLPEDARNSLDYNPDPLGVGTSQRTDRVRWTQVTPGDTYVFVPDSQENRAMVAEIDSIMGSGSAIVPPGVPAAGSRLAAFGRLDNSVADSYPTVISNRRIRMWPYALRITVRVYDRNGRLETPIVRSLIHRFD